MDFINMQVQAKLVGYWSNYVGLKMTKDFDECCHNLTGYQINVTYTQVCF